jgi:hypothetical protein
MQSIPLIVPELTSYLFTKLFQQDTFVCNKLQALKTSQTMCILHTTEHSSKCGFPVEITPFPVKIHTVTSLLLESTFQAI